MAENLIIIPTSNNEIDFTKLLSQACDLFKKKCPEVWESILENGIVIGEHIINIKFTLSQISKLDKLINLTKAGRTKTIKEVKGLLKATKVNGLSGDTFLKLTCSDTESLSNYDAIKDEILKLLKDEKQSQANACIGISSIFSFILIVAEFYIVYKAWGELKDAEYVIKESKQILVNIQSKINKIKTKIDTLNEIIVTSLKYKNVTQEVIMNIIRIEIPQLRGSLNEIRTTIGDVKVKLNNGIDTIRKCGDNQVVHAITNFGQVIGSLWQLCKLAGKASAPYILIQLVITGAFIALGGLNIDNKICCDKTIEKFRNAMEEATKLDNLVDELEKDIEKAEKIAKEYFGLKLPDELKSLLLKM